MTKRAFDILCALVGLTVTFPVMAFLGLLVWLSDGASPLYHGKRVGLNGRDFRMLKLRTMVPGADRIGSVSTARSDRRITGNGHLLRRYKLDELPQLWNVLAGDMSMVGPRPNVRRHGVDGYSAQEMRLLEVRPGITDLASIVFADEAQVIDGAADPHQAYEALIRPWKSRLGLLYVANHSLPADVILIFATVLGLVSRPLALRAVAMLLKVWGADTELRRICARREPLRPQTA